MRIFKFLLGFLLFLVFVGSILAFVFWDKLVRLNSVNTLFSEQLIVSNFSNMDKAFFNSPIPSKGNVEVWETANKSLPKTFNSPLGEREVFDWLEQTQTTSFLVIQDGKIAFEEYYLGTKKDDLRISWSVAKSFLSAAFGIAVSEGKIDIEKSVDSYVPAFKGTTYEGVLVRNVLTMSSGVEFNEDYLDFWSDINKMGRVLAVGGSMDEFATSLESRKRKQGVVREYISIDTHVLAMVLRAATGEKLANYLADKVITPIGFMRQPFYLTDSEGNAFALGGLNITTRDYARFGQMFLNGGKWNGEQVIPQSWVQMSTIEQAGKPEAEDGFGYGYQWWIPDGSTDNGNDYVARGIYGQYIYINPQSKTVIIRTAANRKFREKLHGDLVENHIYMDLFRTIAEAVTK